MNEKLSPDQEELKASLEISDFNQLPISGLKTASLAAGLDKNPEVLEAIKQEASSRLVKIPAYFENQHKEIHELVSTVNNYLYGRPDGE
jgi:hypothetical protein